MTKGQNPRWLSRAQITKDFAMVVKRYGPFRDAVDCYEKLEPVGARTGDYRSVLIQKNSTRKLGIHRAVAMVKLGRELRPGEQVHHVDGNPLNNHPDNLEVLSYWQHRAEHGLEGTGVFFSKRDGSARFTSGPNFERPVGRVLMEKVLGRKLRKDEWVFRLSLDPKRLLPECFQVLRGKLTRTHLIHRCRYAGREKALREVFGDDAFERANPQLKTTGNKGEQQPETANGSGRRPEAKVARR